MKIPAHIFYVKDDRFGRIFHPAWEGEHYAPDDYVYITTIPVEVPNQDPLFNEILGDVFRRMNVVDGSDLELPLKLKCRSMSVGDLVVMHQNLLFLCANVGWKAQQDVDFNAALNWPDTVCCHAPDGKHVADPGHVVPADYEADENIVVDIYCKLCGRSGSTLIKPEDINW